MAFVASTYMAFSTSGRPSLLTHTVHSQELRDRIDDLETAFSCNLSLLQDISCSKPAPDQSLETDAVLLFPTCGFKRLQAVQTQLEGGIRRIAQEVGRMERKAGEKEREMQRVAVEEYRRAREMEGKVKRMKEEVRHKEEHMQALERDSVRLEQEVTSIRLNLQQSKETLEAPYRLQRLIREVKAEIQSLSTLKTSLRAHCLVTPTQSLEAGLTQDRVQFKARERAKVAEIEGKQYGLEVSYEAYWGCKGLEKGVKGDLGELPPASKLQELEVALELKQEELRSLQRLSGVLAAFQGRVLNSIHRLQCSAGQQSEYEVIEGFAEEIEWPETG